MTKKLVIVSFLLSFSVALYVFFSREERSIRDSIKDSKKEPRIELEDFVIYRYQDNDLVGKLTSRIGNFYEPNLIELISEVKGERYIGNEMETMESESAVANLKSKSLVEVLSGKDISLDVAELTGFVEVGINSHLLSTDYAKYEADKQMILSDRPVRVTGLGRVIDGSEGFSYFLEDQAMVLPGHIKGQVV